MHSPHPAIHSSVVLYSYITHIKNACNQNVGCCLILQMKEQGFCIHAETSEMSNKMVKTTSYLKITWIELKFQLSLVKLILRFTEIQSAGSTHVFVYVLTQIIFL